MLSAVTVVVPGVNNRTNDESSGIDARMVDLKVDNGADVLFDVMFWAFVFVSTVDVASVLVGWMPSESEVCTGQLPREDGTDEDDVLIG